MRVQDQPTVASTWWTWCRVAALTAGLAVLAWQGWHMATAILDVQPLGIDFLPMWAGAHEAFIHPQRVYDFVRLTHFESPLLGDFHGLRPFVYPPTALLLFWPFGQLSFVTANAVWTAMGVVAILLAMALQVKTPRVIVLTAMVLTPSSVLVMLTGQVTFLVAALVVVALMALRGRPAIAGVLLGLAAALKPQALVLAPVALLAIGQWRALLAAGVTVTVLAAASVVVFGLDDWFQWLAAAPKFEHMVMSASGFVKGMITPTALGMFLRLDPGALLIWRLAFGVGALVMAWSVFRATDDPARRLTALLGGGLFITPYAMHYDAALLAPAAAMILTQRTAPGPWFAALAASFMLCCGAIPHWGAAGVTGFVLIVALVPESAFSGRPAPAPRLAVESPA